jgi:hypothetical protein
VAASSGRASQRPFIAVRKSLPSATASRLDAAYGRSLTYCPSVKPSAERPLAERTSAIGSTSSNTAAVQRSAVASG